jgi:hypothetical protein
MEDIIDELKAKHTEPNGVKLERLEKKFEPVEKILREGRLPVGGMVLNSSGLSSNVLTIF